MAALSILLGAIALAGPGMADTVVADFVDDMPPSGGPHAWYNGGEPKHAGWDYMYAPDGVIGTSARYVSLQPCKVASPFRSDVPDPMYVKAGTLVYNDAGQGDARFLRVSTAGIHPGAGRMDVQAIAAYTIQAADGSGSYAITNSFLRNLRNSLDGVDLRVYVNDSLVHSLLKVNTYGGADANFDVSLGNLKVGDSVYVAYGNGARNNSGADPGKIDFTLIRNAETTAAVILRGM